MTYGDGEDRYLKAVIKGFQESDDDFKVRFANNCSQTTFFPKLLFRQIFSESELRSRYPFASSSSPGGGLVGCLEEDAGIIRAEKALEATRVGQKHTWAPLFS